MDRKRKYARSGKYWYLADKERILVFDTKIDRSEYIQKSGGKVITYRELTKLLGARCTIDRKEGLSVATSSRRYRRRTQA